jgi:deoxyribonuclease V
MKIVTIGVTDVHYDDRGGAKAALVVYRDRACAQVENEYVADIARTVRYEPGELFRRELPCIQAVIALGPPLDLLAVDGYATLDPHGRPGLGAHASAAIGVPVIGIAKTPFRTATHAIAVLRGSATRPLYVTTAGFDIAEAARLTADMAGPHRIPSALARADALARGRN